MVSNGEGICTGDARRFVRQWFAALAIKQAQAVVEQGAVFRVIDNVDTRTLSTWMSDKHLRCFSRRMVNGSVSSQNMQIKHYPRLHAGLNEGSLCVLCRGAKGDAQHALFCIHDEMALRDPSK